MSMMVSFELSFFPRDVLDEILNLIESVSEDFPSYFLICRFINCLFIHVTIRTILTLQTCQVGLRNCQSVVVMNKDI